MKRILFSLAAIAALASCVKENIAVPAEGQLTISAVSADSKTVLDGLNVVWENTDKIAVVVNADTKVTADFSIVESTLDGSAADFVGTVGAFKNATSAYAVYPAAAVELTHTLPADQTTGVSGLMLSSAALDVEQMEKGAVTAVFNPALSLLQVAVPAGVKSVELTSAEAALVGPATFEVNADGSLALEPTAEATKTVVLAAEAGLEAKVYPVVVYPGTAGDLTLKLVGTKGEEFVKTLSNVTFNVAEARAVNLMQIFQFAPEAIEVAPNGGNIEIPFTTTVEEVTVTENADWLESSVAVKGFQTGNVCLVAAANEGDATRTAEVTVSWGQGKSVSFTVTQDAIYRGFLNDADGNPIKWEETFGVYTSESDANAANVANAATTHKNVFTIALSDDYTKGTYLVDNIFKATSYYNNGQPVSNKGGKFYANYKDGKLTLLYANSVNCYGFTSDVTISYDETAKTFSAPALKVYDYSVYRDRYIGGYAAVVKVEEAPGGNNELDKFVGTWSETYVNKPYSWSTETIYENEFTVSVVDGKLYFEGMFLYRMGSTEYRSNYYGTPSADGTTITLEDADSNSPHGYFGPMAYAGGPIVLTVDGNSLTVASAYNGAVTNYVATNMTPPAVSNPLDDFVGPWSETYVNKPYSWSTETIYENEFTVSVVDGKLYFEGMFLYRMGSTEYRSNYYGTPSADGTTITLEDADSNSPHGYFGPMAYAGGPIVLTVDGNSLTVASAYNGAVANYVATKQGAVEPEPEAPAIDFAGLDWASAAVAVNDETATSDLKMKEIRAFGDDEYLYVRLATSQGLPLEANYLDLSFCDGDGSNKVWWGWTTTGTNTYYAEHKGEIDANGKLTGMSFGDAEVICHTEVSEESVTWYLAYPRESVEQYVSAKGKIYVSALLWNEFSPYWAVPARGGAMLAVTLFEDPNSLKNADWNAADVVSYDLPEKASDTRQSLRSVKYFTDADNVKVRIVASAEKLLEQQDGVATTHLGVFLYDVVNGSGNGYNGWWNKAAGNNEYEGEHVGVVTGTDLSLSVNGVTVDVEKVVEGDEVVWMFAIPRSAHANLAANEVNMAFIAYRNWGQTGALPDKYDNMFKVTFPN